VGGSLPSRCRRSLRGQEAEKVIVALRLGVWRRHMGEGGARGGEAHIDGMVEEE
jgi:hypothetical protein